MDDLEYEALLRLAESWEGVVLKREGSRDSNAYVTDPVVGAALELKDTLARLAKRKPPQLEAPNYFFRPSDAPPRIGLPTGWTTGMVCVGQQVRFDAEKVGRKGYDCDKVFTVEGIKFTPDGIEVRLNEELSGGWFPISYFH